MTSTVAWMYVTTVISLLQPQLSSAGDECPPSDTLKPCMCFQDSENIGDYPGTHTTPLPMENLLQRKGIEHVNNLGLREGPKLKLQESTTLTTKPALPPSAACCTLITCNAPKSLLVLEDAIVNALSRKWIDKLIVSNLPPEKDHTLVRFPKAWLKTLRVKHFEVKDTLLSGDFIHSGYPFEGQEQSMLWFTATNCYLGESLTYDTVGTVNTKGLNNMPKIEGVDLSRNHLVLISATSFRYPPTNLSTINLSYNSIQGVESGGFTHIPLLKRLDLSHNLLETIARNIFAAPARYLHHIDLSWNQLKMLPNDMFVNMPLLKVVILGNNFLTSMPNQPWSPIWRQLQFVDVKRSVGSVVYMAVLILILPSLAYSGDPCPPKTQLAPCTCSHVSLNKMLAQMAGIETSVTPPMSTESSKFGLPTASNSLMIPRRVARSDDTTDFPPPPENSSFYTVVTCNVPRTQYVLEDVVANALHRKWVDKLIVSNIPPKKEHTLVRFPRNWLKNLRVKQFEVRDTLLAGDFISGNSPFVGQEQSMVWFTAKNCYLSGGLSYDTAGTVFMRGLSGLPRVEGLDLSRNHLSFIYALAFKYPSANLTTINLSYNSIQGIEGGTFGNIYNLKHLDLSHNLLEGVARSYFASPARYLEHINLSWNHIPALPTDFFVSMPSLRVVNMRNNFLFSMPDKPWDTVWRQLTFVDVTGNFIECDCSLMWLLPILSPPDVNSTTTPAPTPLPGQTVLGSCSQTQPQLYSKLRVLVNLTRSDLNCL